MQIIEPDVIGALKHTLAICCYDHSIISRLSWSEAMAQQAIKLYSGPIESLVNH